MKHILYHNSKNKQYIEAEIDMYVIFDDFYKMLADKKELNFNLKIEEYFFNNADIEHNGNCHYIMVGERTFNALKFFSTNEFKKLLEEYLGCELKNITLKNLMVSNNTLKIIKICFEPKENINDLFYKDKLESFSKKIPSKHLFLQIKNKGFTEDRTLIEYDFVYDKDYINENEEHEIIKELTTTFTDKRILVHNNNNLIEVKVFEIYQKKVN